MAVMNPLELPIEVSEPKTGMAQAVLSELVEQLQELADHGEPHVIDLTSLPMTTTDKHELETLLGKGEVQVTLSTLGESQIIETAYSGVWWIKHFSADNKLLAELIEVSTIPEIIKSHPDDITQAASNIKSASNNTQQESSYE